MAGVLKVARFEGNEFLIESWIQKSGSYFLIRKNKIKKVSFNGRSIRICINSIMAIH